MDCFQCVDGDYTPERMLAILDASELTDCMDRCQCVDGDYIPERMLASLDTSQLIDNMNRLLREYNPSLLLMLKKRRCVDSRRAKARNWHV